MTPHAGAEFPSIEKAIAAAREAARGLILWDGAGARWFELSDAGGRRLADVQFATVAADLHREDPQQGEY